jgi:hypothetical protein
MDSNVATPITAPWIKENIPDEDLLFMRVHKSLVQPGGRVLPKAFENHGDPNDPSKEAGMSTDWERYSTAEECRQRANQVGKDPNKYQVIQLNVGRVREIPDQRVEHTPIFEPPIVDQAHTDVFGEKDEEARLTLFQISRPALPFD